MDGLDLSQIRWVIMRKAMRWKIWAFIGRTCYKPGFLQTDSYVDRYFILIRTLSYADKPHIIIVCIILQWFKFWCRRWLLYWLILDLNIEYFQTLGCFVLADPSPHSVLQCSLLRYFFVCKRENELYSKPVWVRLRLILATFEIRWMLCVLLRW